MFLVYWLVAHVAGDLFCGLFLSQTFGEGPDGGGAKGPLILFGVVFTLLLSFLYQKRFSQDSESKRLYLAALREGAIPFPQKLRRNLKMRLIVTGLDALLLVPYMIVYALFNFNYAAALGIERFYSMDAGVFEIAENAFGGWLLCLVLLFVSLNFFDFLSYRSWEKDRF